MLEYVLVATAVYDQGIVGVYSSEELARAAAEELWSTTDGHHHFRIHVVERDQTYPDSFDRVYLPMTQQQIDEKRARHHDPDVAPIEINDCSGVVR